MSRKVDSAIEVDDDICPETEDLRAAGDPQALKPVL